MVPEWCTLIEQIRLYELMNLNLYTTNCSSFRCRITRTRTQRRPDVYQLHCKWWMRCVQHYDLFGRQFEALSSDRDELKGGSPCSSQTVQRAKRWKCDAKIHTKLPFWWSFTDKKSDDMCIVFSLKVHSISLLENQENQMLNLFLFHFNVQCTCIDIPG